MPEMYLIIIGPLILSDFENHYYSIDEVRHVNNAAPRTVERKWLLTSKWPIK